jgi:hypothetical protein
MGIKINDLNSFGADLFSDSESLMDNIRSLSEDELKISGGGGHGGSSGKGSGSRSGKGSGSRSGKGSGSGSGKGSGSGSGKGYYYYY